MSGNVARLDRYVGRDTLLALGPRWWGASVCAGPSDLEDLPPPPLGGAEGGPGRNTDDVRQDVSVVEDSAGRITGEREQAAVWQLYLAPGAPHPRGPWRGNPMTFGHNSA